MYNRMIMKWGILGPIILAFFLLGRENLFAVMYQCTPQYCEQAAWELTDKCKREGWQARKRITEIMPGGIVCFCPCPELPESRPNMVRSLRVEPYDEILGYWFRNVTKDSSQIENRLKLWFGGGEETDSYIRKNFEKVLIQAAEGKLEEWKKTPHGTLALVILFDQFSRNIYRDQPKGISFDPLALRLSQEAIARGDDRRVHPLERVFFYMPMMHSEDLSVERKSVDYFTRLVDEVPKELKPIFENFRHYAVLHREMIEHFGRFPDRNEMLGRKSTPEELQVLKDYPF